MKKEYLSIQEFADTVGVTTQAIYKRIQLDLQPFVQLVEGKKFIHFKALSLFNLNPNTNFDETTTKQECNQLKQEVAVLRAEKEQFLKRIEDKNKQIESLEKMLDQEQQLHLNLQNKTLSLTTEIRKEKEEVVEKEEEPRGFLQKLFNR